MAGFFPTSWRPNGAALLPADPRVYTGPGVARVMAMVYLGLITARSLVHLLAPDGGAHSIATINIALPGGANIVGLFGQWGAIQLLLAGLMWVMILRYRGLTALVLATLALEPFMRGLAGHLKPIATAGVAPGAALNWIAAPVLIATLYLALCPAAAQGEGRR